MDALHDLRELEPAVLALADALRARGWRMATAESCTGGLIAAACTAVAGSSDWFERGYVTYSNASKTEAIGVDAALIASDGAVSEPVARAMAEGALKQADVDIAVAVTGIAGPGGAVPGKPVGTVWMAWSRRVAASDDGVANGAATVRTEARRLQLGGDRAAVRGQTVAHALAVLTEAAKA